MKVSPLVPSSARFHRPLVPVDEMSLVLFASYLHLFGSPSSLCLSQRLFWPLRVGICWTRTRVQRSCVRISNNSTFRFLRWCWSAALFPGILIRLAFTSVWLPWTRSHMPLSRALFDLAFHARVLLAEVQVDVPWEFPSGPLLSAFPRLDVVPELVQVFQNPFPRQNSISSLELRSFHVDSIALQVVFCELICTWANHVSSSPGVRRTMHLVPTSNHWSICSSAWLLALHDRESTRIPIVTKHAQKGYIWSSKQILEWGSAVGSHCESWEHKSSVTNCKWKGKWNWLKLYASVCLDLCPVASCEFLNVSVYCIDKPVAQMTYFWRKS